MTVGCRNLPVLIAVLVMVGPLSAAAQTTIGFSGGLYVPIGGSIIKDFGGVNGAPVSHPILEKWHVGAAVLMARATRRITPRYGVEAKVAHSPGQVNVRDSLNQVGNRPGFILFLSGRMPILISSATSTFVTHVSPGLALLKRGGGAWAGYGGTTDPAVVLGIDLGGLVGRRSKFSIRFELEGYFSMAQFNSPTVNPTTQRFHPDVMFSVGFDYRIKR